MNKEILEITKKFHDTYEKLASEYTYETREDTKVFDINSNNGKLMYATVNEIVSPILKENEQLKADYGTQAQIERDMLQQENKILKENAENNDKVVDKVNWENMLLKKENKQLKQKYEMQKDSNKLLCKAITCDDCNCKVCEAHKDNIELKKDIKNIIRILNKNCDDLEATEEEFKSLKRWENE